MSTLRNPVAPGEMAPDFALAAVDHDGVVSLADYKGRAPLLLVVFRGLYCPFCRRAIAQLGTMSDRLRAAGVELLAVVATDVANARLYFRLRPARMPLAADPQCSVHLAYGLPSYAIDAPLLQAMATTLVNPTGELPQPLPLTEAGQALNRLHGYTTTPSDQRDAEHQGAQTKGQFLLDRSGVVRWRHVECANDGIAGFGRFPSEDELLGAVRLLDGAAPRP